MNAGAGRKPKFNAHWARMFAAKRRAIDVALLEQAERAIAAEETIATIKGNETAREAIARAFGRPPP